MVVSAFLHALDLTAKGKHDLVLQIMSTIISQRRRHLECCRDGSKCASGQAGDVRCCGVAFCGLKSLSRWSSMSAYFVVIKVASRWEVWPASCNMYVPQTTY